MANIGLSAHPAAGGTTAEVHKGNFTAVPPIFLFAPSGWIVSTGFAKHRDTPHTAMVTIILYAYVQTACDAGAHCAMACFNDSSQWNFIEVRWVSMFWPYFAL